MVKIVARFAYGGATLVCYPSGRLDTIITDLFPGECTLT